MNRKSTKYISYICGVIGVILAIGLDQYTKMLAVRHLKDQAPYIILKDVFQLEYLENRGAAFGLFQNQKVFFVLSAILVFAVIIYCYIKMPKNKRFLPLNILAVLIFAGACGNLIDRIRLGYVVDFFYFILINFPLFNVADIYVTVSFAILVLLILFYYKEEELDMLIPRRKQKDRKEEPSCRN